MYLAFRKYFNKYFNDINNWLSNYEYFQILIALYTEQFYP